MQAWVYMKVMTLFENLTHLKCIDHFSANSFHKINTKKLRNSEIN